MATLSPHRQALKALAGFSIDVQLFQQYGTQIFSYRGEITPNYRQLFNTLEKKFLS